MASMLLDEYSVPFGQGARLVKPNSRNPGRYEASCHDAVQLQFHWNNGSISNTTRNLGSGEPETCFLRWPRDRVRSGRQNR